MSSHHNRSTSSLQLPIVQQLTKPPTQKRKNIRISNCISSQNLRNNAALRKNNNQALSQSQRGKMSANKTPVNKNGLLRKMVSENDPVFHRVHSTNNGQNIVNPFNNKFTTFKGKMKGKYDPAYRETNYNVWDKSKNSTLNELRKNMQVLNGNEELVEKIGKLKGITELRRKFPTYQKYMALGSRYVSNDAHNKVTGPGFSRNNYGKPYFS